MKIQTKVKNIVTNGKDFFATEKEDEFIQEPRVLQNLSEDDCIQPLIQGKTGNCLVTKATNEPKVIQLTNNIILVNNANVNVSSNCGPENRTVNGNFLIKFENCSIWTNKQQFLFKESTRTNKLFFGALQNLNFTQTLIESDMDIKELQKLHVSTRNELQHVSLQQYEHNQKIWSLFGGFSITTVTMIALIVYAFKSKRITKVKIQQLLKPHTKEEPSVQLSDLLTKLSKQDKTHEDTLFYPPEELSVTAGPHPTYTMIQPDRTQLTHK